MALRKLITRWLQVSCMLGATFAAGEPLLAQDRPSEADMFGAPADQPAETPTPAPAPEAANPTPPTTPEVAPNVGAESAPAAAEAPAAASASQDQRDAMALGASSEPMFNQEAAVSDPLTLGGQLYLRMQTLAQRRAAVKDYRFSAPTLLDVYFDARPNDRVRGYVLGRMNYDPTQPDAGAQLFGGSAASDASGSSVAGLSALAGSQTNAPRVALDQLWVRFDMWHTLFVTAGRQHVRWGTARFWTPTDFLHLRRRDPLAVFDVRTGTDMIKLHLPIESNGWNFYAYGVTSNQYNTAALSNIAGAARAEFVAGSNELGLGAFVRRGSSAKFAADLSMGIGDFDVYAEAALTDAGDVDRVRYNPNATLPQIDLSMPPDADEAAMLLQKTFSDFYPVYRGKGYKPQITGGLTYSHKYHDNDTFTVGAEYFYNALGYSDSNVYPGLIPVRPLENAATNFYLGKHYAALFLLFPSPFSLDLHSFTLSTLGNLSDRSFITRFDYSLQLLTHLRFEAFASVNYGKRTGEFRFGFEVPGIVVNEPMLFSLGMGLRLAI